MMNKNKKSEPEEEQEEEILGGGSSFVRGSDTADSGERQGALKRDNEPDDFDLDTNTQDDDRVRGAGDQSLDEITITQEQGSGLEEHIGGLRSDRAEPNVNDPDPEEGDGMEQTG